MIEYQPIMRADQARLASFIGAELRGVSYHFLPGIDETSHYRGGRAGVDADLAAIALEFRNRSSLVVTWAMVGAELHGLAIAAGEPYAGLIGAVHGASDREAWRGHIGQRVISVDASWDVLGDTVLESLWAIRIHFPSGSLVVALGGIRSDRDPRVAYFPDEVVVLFDMSLAGSYVPDDSWCDSIGASDSDRE